MEKKKIRYEYDKRTGFRLENRRKKRKKYTWDSLWACLKLPLYALLALATTGYIMMGSWMVYILMTK